MDDLATSDIGVLRRLERSWDELGLVAKALVCAVENVVGQDALNQLRGRGVDAATTEGRASGGVEEGSEGIVVGSQQGDVSERPNLRGEVGEESQEAGQVGQLWGVTEDGSEGIVGSILRIGSGRDGRKGEGLVLHDC